MLQDQIEFLMEKGDSECRATKLKLVKSTIHSIAMPLIRMAIMEKNKIKNTANNECW